MNKMNRTSLDPIYVIDSSELPAIKNKAIMDIRKPYDEEIIEYLNIKMYSFTDYRVLIGGSYNKSKKKKNLWSLYED